ncbi:MAG: methyltransferase type 11 [Anaerolineae bacterium]|nr:MAG: methyltransferase type 11 [Anaerolineae bacterium]
MDVNRYQSEILQNEQYWQKKPILRRIYREFHEEIARHLSSLDAPLVVELGSGIGNIKEVIPHALRTDLFANPWLDQIENAYTLSFQDATVSDLILFDVFHHLRYPGTALKEFWRVLRPGGRVLVFDPFISLLGLVVYGLLHKEPINWWQEITWYAPADWDPHQLEYYAAQGNATRVFFSRMTPTLLKDWKLVMRKRYAAFSYVASGGYSGPQLYPDGLYPKMRMLDQVLDALPPVFATRILVVLEKPPSAEHTTRT